MVFLSITFSFRSSNISISHFLFHVLKAVVFIMEITVQVKETFFIRFFADTGQSERKSEGNNQFVVTVY